MKEYLIMYAPYVLIAFNAVMSMLNYRKTGKIKGYSVDNPINKINDTPIVDESVLKNDIQAMIEYHKKSAEELEKTLNR